MRIRSRSVAVLGMAGLALATPGGSLHSAPTSQAPAPGQPTCDGAQGPVSFSVKSSRALGRSSTSIPAAALAIKVLVTIPANKSGDAKACGLGDERIDVGTCPAKGDCAGVSIKAGSGAGLDECHDVDQTLGPYDWPIPEGDGVKLDFNAVTAKASTARVELTCKR